MITPFLWKKRVDIEKKMFCHSGHILATKLRHWVSSTNKYNNYQDEDDGIAATICLSFSSLSLKKNLPSFNLIGIRRVKEDTKQGPVVPCIFMAGPFPRIHFYSVIETASSSPFSPVVDIPHCLLLCPDY